MLQVIGIGECMVELSQAGDRLWQHSFAGDVFNTLWYCRAALPEQATVGFHTALGDDPFSAEMLAFAEAAGISCEDCPRIAGGTIGLYAIHLDEGEASRFPVPPAAKVVDTTAAGDSFNGAYLAALLTGAAEAEAIEAAQVCAARVIGAHGALVKAG